MCCKRLEICDVSKDADIGASPGILWYITMSLLITVVGIMVRRLQIYEASARVVVIST
jgi:hypothetical protein